MSQWSRGHKTNYICPVDGCVYHSRKFIVRPSDLAVKHHSHSEKCPKHQSLLLRAGGTLPSVKTNKGRKLRKLYQQRVKNNSK